MGQDRTEGAIGLICNADHDVFAVVADRLEQRGHEVDFLEPGRPVDPAAIGDLALLANKKVAPTSFRALRDAAAAGVPTWNGYGTVLLGVRPFGLAILDRVGFAVPPTTWEPPRGDHVAKPLCDWHDAPDPSVNGDGAVYQELLPAAPFDYKYYGVDDGDRTHVTALRTTSKLYGEKAYLGDSDPDPAVAAKVRDLLSLTDSQAIGVDVVHAGGTPYAVDVNPAMSFRHAEMEGVLADSIAAHARPAPAPAGPVRDAASHAPEEPDARRRDAGEQ